MTKIVLGVGGGIAAYKAAELLRLFTESGHDVRVIPTHASLSFMGRATWEALSGHPVSDDVFENVADVEHVRIGRQAELVVIAPATADLLARAAGGMADDLLTNTLLTADCPIMFAPAMHTEMWENSATQANVATLRTRGATVVEPATGRLTGVDSGAGRLPEPVELFHAAQSILGGTQRDLANKHVVISAGGTREFIDPVRFLGNSSSGRQGLALAESAAARGAEVTLVAANVGLPAPPGVQVVDVQTTEQLRGAVKSASHEADVVVMAAAVADFTPQDRLANKVKKTTEAPGLQLDLVPTTDVLAELVRDRTGRSPVIVGFAAETGDENGSVIEHGRAKLTSKRCDYLIVNDVSAGKVFGSQQNEAVILSSDGSVREIEQGPKLDLAHAVWDTLVRDAAMPG